MSFLKHYASVYVLIHRFVVCLTMLSAAVAERRRIRGWLVNNELNVCGRERSWPNLRFKCHICLETTDRIPLFLQA